LSQWNNLYQSLFRQSLYQQSPPRSPSVSRYDGTETTMVPGTLRGYRVWKLHPNGLASLSIGRYVWGSGTEQARCLMSFSSHSALEAPVRRCTCGLYAKHTLDAVEDEFMSGSLMYGSIKAHGRIILGDSGFRAERAEIEALLWQGSPIRYTDPDGELAIVLNSVPFYTSRKKFLKDYPPISVGHLLPEEAPKDQVQYWGPAAVLDEDQAQLWLDQIRIRGDARRAGLLPLYERKMEQ